MISKAFAVNTVYIILTYNNYNCKQTGFNTKIKKNPFFTSNYDLSRGKITTLLFYPDNLT